MNNIRLKHNLIENPQLRDEIINVDETSKSKEQQIKSKKEKGVKVSKDEGLSLLTKVIDSMS